MPDAGETDQNFNKKKRTDRISLVVFVCAVTLIVFSFGAVVGKYRIFPYQIFSMAEKGATELTTQMLRFGITIQKNNQVQLPWYYKLVNEPHSETLVRKTGEASEGTYLVTRVGWGLKLCAEIIDMNGQTLHKWAIDWFRIWSDCDHLPAGVAPKSKPGTHIHGALVMKNGDLVFNFEHFGLVRINSKSEIVWRLPYQTHHSIHRHDDGNLWVCGQRRRFEPNPKFPGRKPPFDEYTLLEVAPKGEIVHEWSVSELLYKNGLSGLVNIRLNPKSEKRILDDRLHLNDVEPFPGTMEEGFFKKGDVIVSLRNINTVFVFNRHTEKIKYCKTGIFTHQHDPDFIDGNTFSVFDNTSLSPDGYPKSRIMIVNAAGDTTELFFEGSRQNPFHTDIMGKHQWLPSGNLLITESLKGRAFEVNRRGEVVWEYTNYVYKGVVGLVEEVQRLPSAQKLPSGNISDGHTGDRLK